MSLPPDPPDPFLARLPSHLRAADAFEDWCYNLRAAVQPAVLERLSGTSGARSRC